jgi:N-acetyl-anhydromuramyl-L-alanine amidase AmpD
MAESLDFPAEVLAAQREFFAVEARCKDIARRHPRPGDVAAGRAEIAPEQHAEFAAALEWQRRLAERLAAYWVTVEPGTRTQARLRYGKRPEPRAATVDSPVTAQGLRCSGRSHSLSLYLGTCP